MERYRHRPRGIVVGTVGDAVSVSVGGPDPDVVHVPGEDQVLVFQSWVASLEDSHRVRRMELGVDLALGLDRQFQPGKRGEAPWSLRVGGHIRQLHTPGSEKLGKGSMANGEDRGEPGRTPLLPGRSGGRTLALEERFPLGVPRRAHHDNGEGFLAQDPA
jgi:hypothetical protein